jgi:hypothetical protein
MEVFEMQSMYRPEGCKALYEFLRSDGGAALVKAHNGKVLKEMQFHDPLRDISNIWNYETYTAFFTNVKDRDAFISALPAEVAAGAAPPFEKYPGVSATRVF